MPVRWQLFAIGAALLVPLSAGCTSSPTAPTVTPEFTQTEIVIGLGDPAATGEQLNVRYTGWLYDTSKPSGKGNQFDSGQISFVLGAGRVIRGWDQGILGMRIGGSRRLIIPPELAYGSSTPDASKIPPNGTLLFDVTLLQVQ